MIAVLLGVLAATFWSLHDLLARNSAARIGAMHMTVGVVIAGGILLLPIVLVHGTVWQASAGAVGQSLLLGLAYGTGIGGLMKALSLGPISLVGPLTATYPALVIAWNVVQGVHPTPLQWLAVAATLLGGAIVSRAGHHDGGINAVARKDLLPLFFACALCMLGYAASVVIGQEAAVAIGEYEATWISRASAFLTLLPFMAREERPPPLRLRHWLAIAAMGLLDVAGQVAVNVTGFLPNHAYTAIGIAAYGAISTILAWSILKERVSPGQWCGVALIVLGVAGLTVA